MSDDRNGEISLKVSQRWQRILYQPCVPLGEDGRLITGTCPSENRELLERILREEWGYRGVITTDRNNDAEHYREVLAGNDICMPSGSKKRVRAALEHGYLTRADLEKCAKRVPELLLKFDRFLRSMT